MTYKGRIGKTCSVLCLFTTGVSSSARNSVHSHFIRESVLSTTVTRGHILSRLAYVADPEPGPLRVNAELSHGSYFNPWQKPRCSQIY